MNFGVLCNLACNAFTRANMPIMRYRRMLLRERRSRAYMTLLRNAHRNEKFNRVMCRGLVSVDRRGYLYDCDFNQMLELQPAGEGA